MAQKSDPSPAAAEDELAPFVIPSEDIKGLKTGDHEEAGCGAYGVVHKVTVKGLPCMSKRLHKILAEAEQAGDNERNIMKDRFRNECITLSYGKDKRDIILIMERLHSDLVSFFQVYPQIMNQLCFKLSILLDVSYGLLYLHTRHHPIVHRDLTARNILITADGVAKIADLGVAKLLTPKASQAVAHTTAPGQLFYMPPEALKEDADCTPKIDIFSFGHLAIYTVNGQAPEVFNVMHKVTPEDQQEGKIEAMRREAALNKVGQDHCMYTIITQCLHDDPTHRLDTNVLNKEMKELATKYPKEHSLQSDEIDRLTMENKNLKSELLTSKQESFQASYDRETFKVELQQLQQNMKKFGEISAANGELQYKVSQLVEQLKQMKIDYDVAKSEAETAKAQALIYQSDFEEERKDREKAHSNLADLEKKLAKDHGYLAEENAELKRQLALYQKELKQVNENLERQKRSLVGMETKNEKLQNDLRATSVYWLGETAKMKTEIKQVKQLKNEAEKWQQSYQATQSTKKIHQKRSKKAAATITAPRITISPQDSATQKSLAKTEVDSLAAKNEITKSCITPTNHSGSNNTSKVQTMQTKVLDESDIHQSPLPISHIHKSIESSTDTQLETDSEEKEEWEVISSECSV